MKLLMVSLSIKRLFDLLVAASVLLVLSPLIALISLAIKLDDGGPILFIQDRVGKGREEFPLLQISHDGDRS